MPEFRLAGESDAAAIQAIYAPFCRDDSHVSFEIEPPPIEEIGARIARTLAQFPWIVAEDRGEVIGYSYAYTHNERAAYRWSTNAAIYLGERARRQGLGRALYTSLFAVLKLQGYYNVFAGITLPNPASEGLHRAMGFQPVGIYRSVGYKAGSWRDTAWFGLHLREPTPDPEPPRPLPAVLDDPGWEPALRSGFAHPG